MTFERIPEQSVAMHEQQLVEAFHEAGSSEGPLFPIYHFNAEHLSKLIPESGTVVDMGCGSAQFLSYLLKVRPDIKAVGVDLSVTMLDHAKQNISFNGLTNRVRFVHKDICILEHCDFEDVDVIYSLSALHHCPDFDTLVKVLNTFKKIHNYFNSSLWLFDLVRPDNEKIIHFIPQTFEISNGKKLNTIFKQDWIASLKAGWTFDEFKKALEIAEIKALSHYANYSQLHVVNGKFKDDSNPLWKNNDISEQDLKIADRISKALIN